MNDKELEAAMKAAQERSDEPLRDILKRERDEAQKRPPNVALEKHGESFIDMLRYSLEVPRSFYDEMRLPKKQDEDLDR